MDPAVFTTMIQMNRLLKINWLLITALSIATGLFKIFQQPEDIELFAQIGFKPTHTTLLGVLQFVGGLFLIFKRTRKYGVYIMIPTFALASIAVFANEMVVFGAISLLFIGMAYLVLLMGRNSKK